MVRFSGFDPKRTSACISCCNANSPDKSWRLQTGSLSDRKRLIEIGEDVVDVLDADRQPHIAIGDAGLRLLLGRELRVGRLAG